VPTVVKAIALFNPGENVFPDGRKVKWGCLANGEHQLKDMQVVTLAQFTHCRHTLIVLNESFRIFRADFHSAKATHRFV